MFSNILHHTVWRNVMGTCLALLCIVANVPERFDLSERSTVLSPISEEFKKNDLQTRFWSKK